MARNEERRRQVHAWVSEDALAGWHAFARAHHSNVAALLEALGVKLAELADEPPPKLPALLRDVVAESLRVAGKRSGRGPRSGPTS